MITGEPQGEQRIVVVAVLDEDGSTVIEWRRRYDDRTSAYTVYFFARKEAARASDILRTEQGKEEARTTPL